MECQRPTVNRCKIRRIHAAAKPSSIPRDESLGRAFDGVDVYWIQPAFFKVTRVVPPYASICARSDVYNAIHLRSGTRLDSWRDFPICILPVIPGLAPPNVCIHIFDLLRLYGGGYRRKAENGQYTARQILPERSLRLNEKNANKKCCQRQQRQNNGAFLNLLKHKLHNVRVCGIVVCLGRYYRAFPVR